MKPLTEGMRGMIDYVSPLVDERIVNPGDDFISVLAQGEKRGIFTRHQVLVNTSLLLLAGHETTINLLCNGTLSFIRHPDQWELLKQDPAGRAKRATEECLRYDSPVKSIQRIASQDVEMRGKLLRKDDRLRWFISSANRDPEVFAEPGRRSTSRRDPNPHVAFGSGVHHCLGATLARVEGQEVFKALAERFPDAAAGDGGAGVSAQHHVPLAEIAARAPGIRRDESWRENCASGWTTTCVGNAMCETFAPQVFRLNDNRQSEVVNPDGRHRGEDSRGRGELPGQCDLRRGCRDRGAVVPLAVDQLCGNGWRCVPSPAWEREQASGFYYGYVCIVPLAPSLPSVCSYQRFSSHYLLDS